MFVICNLKTKQFAVYDLLLAKWQFTPDQELAHKFKNQETAYRIIDSNHALRSVQSDLQVWDADNLTSLLAKEKEASKRWVVRVRIGMNKGTAAIIECLQDAKVLKIISEDHNGASVDIFCPHELVMCPSTQMWAEQSAAQWRAKGYSATAMEEVK